MKASHQNAVRALGNGALEAHGFVPLRHADIPDLTSGFRVFRREYILEFVHLLAEPLLVPDDEHACLSQGGLHREVRADCRKQAARRQERAEVVGKRREVRAHHLAHGDAL